LEHSVESCVYVVVTKMFLAVEMHQVRDHLISQTYLMSTQCLFLVDENALDGC